MKKAQVIQTYIIVGQGKWDIPAYLDDGDRFGLDLAYLTVRDSHGAAFTVDRAHAFVRDATIVFGFPDIQFTPNSAFRQLLAKLHDSSADVILGLFPTVQPHKADMVDCDDEGRVRTILVKPLETDLRLTWITAVWTPSFTDYLHAYVEQRMTGRGSDADGREVHIGHVMQAGIGDGMTIDSVTFPEGAFRDIGTPGDLALAFAEHARNSNANS
jgi:glucose-1-phosphate thymidylyltransferase